MQKKEIAVFIDQVTRERATGDLLIVGWAIDEVAKEIPATKTEKGNMIVEATYVVRLDTNHLHNLDVKTQNGFEVRSSGKMRGKTILDFQTARHQNGIAMKLNDKYPYDDGIGSSWRREKRLLKKGINYARTHSVKKAVRRVGLELKPGSIGYVEWINRREKPDLKEQRKGV